MSNALIVCDTSIAQHNNLYRLNDLHQAAGGEDKHRPTFFVRRQETQELIAELGASADSQTPLEVINDGLNNGTYACKQIVIAYAAWISPAFHLKVLDVFLQTQQPQFNIPQTYSGAMRLAADLNDELEATKKQLTHAVRTKGQISSSREASVMAQLGHAKRTIEKLQQPSEYIAVTAISWLGDYMPINLSTCAAVGKRLVQISHSLGLDVQKIPDARFGRVNAYHKRAIKVLKTFLDTDPSYLSFGGNNA